MFRGISDISDNKMQFSVILTFREEWLDDRLKFENMQGNINHFSYSISLVLPVQQSNQGSR
ncbi:Glutamate-gated chloride channel [Daphnia magna]|uniref:Glutamate-gated chloride channel n=1 Tax=Daphnia magna TaxID=35525 RepID=A0A162CZT2_9CRUS|nr:Glutamate-gated chloride channel [Daphnia magna]